MTNDETWDEDSDSLETDSETDVPLSQSIVIKIWLEPHDLNRTNGWRARLTHVPSGRVVHVQNLHEIVIFIIHVLEGMGAHLPLRWRLYRWLHNRFSSRAMFLRVSDTTVYERKTAR